MQTVQEGDNRSVGESQWKLIVEKLFLCSSRIQQSKVWHEGTRKFSSLKGSGSCVFKVFDSGSQYASKDTGLIYYCLSYFHGGFFRTDRSESRRVFC